MLLVPVGGEAKLDSFLSRSKAEGEQLSSLYSVLMIFTGAALLGEEGRLPLPGGLGLGQLVARGGRSERQAGSVCANTPTGFLLLF